MYLGTTKCLFTNKSLAEVIFFKLLTIIGKMQRDFMSRLLENLFISLPIYSLHV